MMDIKLEQLKTELRICTACGEPIADKYLFDIDGCAWHGSCLRCSVCLTLLERQPSCYFRDRQVYCRTDYVKTFGAKCSKCCRTIAASDWVRKARDLVFHLACFSCDTCGRQLSTGEQFALIDDKVMCKIHYMDTVEDGSNSSDDGCSSDGYNKNKSKRVRTTFTEEQLQVLQANFQIDSNPDGQDLERIAQLTGLSKRVTQVWFQNSRARQKKHTHVPRDHNPNLFNALRQDMNNNSSGQTGLGDHDHGPGMGKHPGAMFNSHGNSHDSIPIQLTRF
ncbi:LIM/homeobox protein Awh-like isoform X1 [Anopheles funestus]|uniref:LIM/homeobox protein Awh-like isoform X1 n=1 Tax=Anopheles funestus TaxID=62324 RepID=UPI0020C6D5BD|nr:LIM/homeobox protein Awh-like isoform X1 [Anopheles funestus]